MSQNNLKEAIAEAKTIRETAIANAKLALEEAFTPKIQSMLSNKLQEMEDLDETTEVNEVSEDAAVENAESNETSNEISEEELDSILAELELDENGGKETVEEVTDVTAETEETLEEEIDIDSLLQEIDLEEAKKKKDEDADEPKKDEKKDKEPKEAKKADKKDEDVDLESLSIDDLKDLIKDIVADVVGGEEKGEEASEEEVKMPAFGNAEVPSEEVPLEEISALRQELNEVNLLNSKLLYVSKILKENNLSESQKLKIVDTFDKATSVKETKLVYETLKEAFGGKNSSVKHSINESVKLGFASKPTGANAKPIVETDAVVARFQKLAGI